MITARPINANKANFLNVLGETLNFSDCSNDTVYMLDETARVYKGSVTAPSGSSLLPAAVLRQPR